VGNVAIELHELIGIVVQVDVLPTDGDSLPSLGTAVVADGLLREGDRPVAAQVADVDQAEGRLLTAGDEESVLVVLAQLVADESLEVPVKVSRMENEVTRQALAFGTIALADDLQCLSLGAFAGLHRVPLEQQRT